MLEHGAQSRVAANVREPDHLRFFTLIPLRRDQQVVVLGLVRSRLVGQRQLPLRNASRRRQGGSRADPPGLSPEGTVPCQPRPTAWEPESPRMAPEAPGQNRTELRSCHHFIAPFQGENFGCCHNPGRRSAADAAPLCPGLSCYAPSGQETKRTLAFASMPISDVNPNFATPELRGTRPGPRFVEPQAGQFDVFPRPAGVHSLTSSSARAARSTFLPPPPLLASKAA